MDRSTKAVSLAHYWILMINCPLLTFVVIKTSPVNPRISHCSEVLGGVMFVGCSFSYVIITGTDCLLEAVLSVADPPTAFSVWSAFRVLVSVAFASVAVQLNNSMFRCA